MSPTNPWKGITLTKEQLNIANVDVAGGDKVKVMFWVNLEDDITPVVTQKLEKTL